MKTKRDTAATAANRARRIAKDKADKERARRKREQRIRATLNPKREAWTVSMVQQVFGDTHARLCGWLADKANFHVYRELSKEEAQFRGNNTFTFRGVRIPFVTRNGHTVSIQQSATHYCGAETVEMWHCRHHAMLEPYGEGSSDPYAHVPLKVVAAYIDWLETLPAVEVKK